MPTDPALLDDPVRVRRHDPKGMYDLAAGFPAQLDRAAAIAAAADLPSALPGIRSVVVSGLGGSAAGGDVARVLMEAGGRVPLQVNRDYLLPAWAGGSTLVYATSYSGNTEETLSAYDDARRRGCAIIAVTSGGALAERAARDGVPCVRIPGGQPPRTAMGYLLVPVLDSLGRLGLLPAPEIAGAAAAVDRAIAAWRAEVPAARNEAKQLAALLHGAVGILYGLEGWAALVANRWKGQINENAKQHVFVNTYPELDHNEILAWEGAGDQGVARWVTLHLGAGAEGPRARLRADVTSRLIAGATSVREVAAPAGDLLTRVLALAALGDFVSLYLAALREVDPYTIASIDTIKTELGRVPMA